MVYVMLADGFEEVEAITPIDIMRRCGIDVTTVSIMDSAKVIGSHDITVTADTTINAVNTSDMKMIMLPGGGKGTQLLDASSDVHRLLNDALVSGAYIAAICAAPSILGKKMMLDGKKATCFPGFEKYLYGASVSSDKVCVDGKIITGKGAGAAAEFGCTLASLLTSEKQAQHIMDVMQY